jgi:hypothetical protein
MADRYLDRGAAERTSAERGDLGPAGFERIDVGRADRLRRWAWLLDEVFRVPGTNFRFGLDALLGLLPGGGDLAGGVISAYTLFIASRLGAPPAVLARMGINVALDALFGAVPLLGDLFDAGFKANRRNVDLIQRYLDDPQPVHRSSTALVVAIVAGLALMLVGAAVVAVKLIGWMFSRF